MSDAATMAIGDAEIVETPVTIPQEFGNLSGILTVPTDGRQPVCIVMLNAGAIRRIGPNRMWVEAARRWAARGVPSLRVDVEAIGEADGAVSPYADDNALYVDELIPQVKAAIAFLAEQGVAERFVTVGLCAGAYWAMYVGLEDPRVTAALMFNSRGIVWDTGISASRDLRRAFSQKLTWARIRHNVTGPRLRAVLRFLLAMPGRWLDRRRDRRRGGEDAGSLQDRVNARDAPAADRAAALRVPLLRRRAAGGGARQRGLAAPDRGVAQRHGDPSRRSRPHAATPDRPAGGPRRARPRRGGRAGARCACASRRSKS